MLADGAGRRAGRARGRVLVRARGAAISPSTPQHCQDLMRKTPRPTRRCLLARVAAILDNKNIY